MSQKHRHCSRSESSSSGSQRKSEKERSMLGPSTSGSVLSVTDRPRPQGETLFVMPNGWTKAGDLDPGLLPTPEQTPLQQKRPAPSLRLSDSGSGWDQSQTFLNSVGTQCPPPPPSAIFLSSKLLGDRRHEDVIERQRYVSLSKYREHGTRPGTLLRKSAGDYNYPMTPQDSPDRRRVVSAPSTQMEYTGEALRWTHENYVFHAVPTPGHRYTAGTGHPASLARTVLHGSRGLMDLADFSHLLGKGGNERAPSGQWRTRKRKDLQKRRKQWRRKRAESRASELLQCQQVLANIFLFFSNFLAVSLSPLFQSSFPILSGSLCHAMINHWKWKWPPLWLIAEVPAEEFKPTPPPILPPPPPHAQTHTYKHSFIQLPQSTLAVLQQYVLTHRRSFIRSKGTATNCSICDCSSTNDVHIYSQTHTVLSLSLFLSLSLII